MSTSNSVNYADCVSSLRTSLKFLESSVETLDSGVSDFPRLVNVLKSVRHYELIPQSTLAAAESSLRDEIGPYIALLLSRADAQTERQDRRIETLKARSQLQKGRLVADTHDAGAVAESSSSSSKSRAVRGGRALTGEDKLRARALRQRKEALRYGVERLELEVLQKERELRKQLDE